MPSNAALPTTIRVKDPAQIPRQGAPWPPERFKRSLKRASRERTQTSNPEKRERMGLPIDGAVTPGVGICAITNGSRGTFTFSQGDGTKGIPREATRLDKTE
ncbi:hypothetical protein CCR75_004836 [Bremia lactucae]|uniref:Uncharacterized protein n=1 Tax=Bremia lactucae TaxID=4779 RepID=A0A976ICP4_BRELC|nr:hypothetical protein CCR75_004836 [Bremia lactucae]